jgi:hypothetical protein
VVGQRAKRLRQPTDARYVFKLTLPVGTSPPVDVAVTVNVTVSVVVAGFGVAAGMS